MKSTLNKIFLCFCIVISVNACHTFEHQNIFIQNKKNNISQQINKDDNLNEKIDNKKTSSTNEMAPIKTPDKKEKVAKVALQKNVKIPTSNDYNLAKFKNLSEFKLIQKLGNSNFIKEEGKLKNFQYYLKECFLDVYLIRKNNQYFVNYIEKRPTELNGKININACNEEIYKILN